MDGAHDEIAARWSEKLYRAHRVFFWAGCHAFMTYRLQAYHVVSERWVDHGPRPGSVCRFAQFAGSLR